MLKVRRTLIRLNHCYVDLKARQQHEIYDKVSDYVDAVFSVEFFTEIFEEDVAADADYWRHGVKHFESVIEEDKDNVLYG